MAFSITRSRAPKGGPGCSFVWRRKRNEYAQNRSNIRYNWIKCMFLIRKLQGLLNNGQCPRFCDGKMQKILQFQAYVV